MNCFPNKKSDIVREFVSRKEFKKALKIAKDFRLGITKQDSDYMKRAYECMIYPDFYKQLGFDTKVTIQKGIQIVQQYYGK